MIPLGTSIIDVLFIGMIVFVFGYIIYNNIVETRKARRKLREAERNREKP
jgi:hypothetical protein